jgi:osmotically-inducible protein OsmY
MKRSSKRAVLFIVFLCIILGSVAIAAPDRANDETITFWVKESLREDPRVDDSKIKVSTQSGIVTLTGQVPNLSSKKYADLEVEKIRGVRGVIDKLIVFVKPRSDTDITQDLLRAFLNTADLGLHDLAVRVVNGRVTLTGQVESWSQRDEAQLIATELRGVTSVDNQVKVTEKAQRPDEEIRKDVIDALGRDVYLMGILIDVQVKDGVVTLTGKVATPYQKERATEDGLLIENVKDVKDYMEVGAQEEMGVRRNAPLPSNSELEKSVRDELYQDLRVIDPFHIDVEATDGHVILRGSVASHYQKRLASHDAQDVVGVVWVTNLLSVGTEWREDQSVRDDVRFALDADSTLSGLNIVIRVKDGVVTLYGDVNTFPEKEHAADVASRVLGVRDVINNITVNKIIKHSDRALKDRIKERLSANWETHWVADQIEVGVKDGVVTLAGDVTTWSEYKEAARIASLTDGVWGVVNRLRVLDVDYPWDEYMDNP